MSSLAVLAESRCQNRRKHVIFFILWEGGVVTSQSTKIRIYTLSTCSHCNRTKKFFKDAGIDVEFTDVDLLSGSDRETIMNEVRKLNPDCTFPTICIGDKVVVGFNEERIRKALGE
jgi:glutaredoxin-like protein NrdH